MKSLLQDDRAYGNMSFVVVVALLALLMSGGMANLLTFGTNVVFTLHNSNVDDGIATEQTASNLEFAKNTFRLLSVLTVLGVLVWAKMHSNIENTNVDATLLIGSVVAMYVLSFVSMCLVLAFGMTLDVFTITVQNAGLHDNLSASWDGVQDKTIPIISIVYLACQLPCFVGIFAFFMNAVRKTTGESVQYDNYQLSGED